MAPRRDGQGDGRDLDTRPAEVPLAFTALRGGDTSAAADKPGKGNDDDRISLFWRVFGGTILSIVALIAVTLFNNLTTSITALQSDLARANEARANAVTELRGEMAKAAEARADLVRKEEFSSRTTNLWDRMQAIQTLNNGQNATVTTLRTEVDGLKERLTRDAADLGAVKKDAALAMEALKKDQAATTDAIKKDVASLELVREKLAALAVDMKAARDDQAKLRSDVEKNQAYDFERRNRRDAQYKHIDEAIKELQKAVQDSREKLARLEALTAPAAPVSAAGGVAPAGGVPPAAPKKGPTRATPPRPIPDPSAPKPGPAVPDQIPAPKDAGD